ncbi:hypothetical protein FFLO_03134 [Filobasidium floriforme]|uniref:Tetraspanin n=1 Tax=Filobasidium floriforme TaxID=5210 RepID=A0A8K0JMT1_9TREE|nr:uncharacterized protein HD553DRAFT_304720 [Filobasidium floriforme]KAG7549021.1 hypothetical protein FFLO_03134 [Filobasidium floriforme]KAH8089756.1 hypothetical protein HD553DRAFT_304720 [Filobasidium floriforme]
MNKLKLVWWLLNLCLLAAGVVAIGYAAVVSKGEDLLISMAVTKHDEKIGTFTGACLLASFLLSIVAITRPVYRNKLLIAFNWTLVVNMCVATAVGTSIWFVSLRQRNHFAKVWVKQSPNEQAHLQNKFSCCGYYNATTEGLFMTALGFCADTEFAEAQRGCIDEITTRTDYTLENVFTSIYGFVGIVGALFLATVCVINERKLEVRFAKIDAKRGGSGFV